MAEARETDPRRERSRARLIDATIALLRNGGVQAVTFDAVARESGVARTTLYRHFATSDALLAAAFGELLPEVEPPPSHGSLEDRLIELLVRQMRLIEQAPIHLTTIAWLAVVQRSIEHGKEATEVADERRGDAETGSLRDEIVRLYRRAFDEVLGSEQAKAELGAIDVDLAISQLLGPLVFAHLVGLEAVNAERCAQLVRDFLAVRRPAGVDGRQAG